MKGFFLLLFLVVIWSFYSPSSNSQPVLNNSIPGLERPNLELQIINLPEVTNYVFPGAKMNLEVQVSNTGNKPANYCWLKGTSDSPSLVVQTNHVDLFTLQPGEKMVVDIPVEIRRNAPFGISRLTLEVDEGQDANMFPPRQVTFFIEEAPDFELAVTDFAVRGRDNLNVVEQFDNVEVIFRVQNCGERNLENIAAYVEAQEYTIASQANPFRQIGTLTPGEFRDISGVFSTGLTSEGIGVDVRLIAGADTISQPFFLKFFQEYKSPDLLSDNACQNYIPGLSKTDFGFRDNKVYVAPSPSNFKFAIIIGNQNYTSVENLLNAGSEALFFKDILEESNRL
jgi:hypothetical protein